MRINIDDAVIERLVNYMQSEGIDSERADIKAMIENIIVECLDREKRRLT